MYLIFQFNVTLYINRMLQISWWIGIRFSSFPVFHMRNMFPIDMAVAESLIGDRFGSCVWLDKMFGGKKCCLLEILFRKEDKEFKKPGAVFLFFELWIFMFRLFRAWDSGFIVLAITCKVIWNVFLYCRLSRWGLISDFY